MDINTKDTEDTENEILMVGSSRIRDLVWKRQPGFKITIVCKGGLQHEDLVQIVDQKINSNTKIIILVCLQVELHSIKRNRNGQKGLVYANPTPPLDSIVQRLSLADQRWRNERGVSTVVWVAPYTPNLLLYNETIKRRNKWGPRLMEYEKEAAIHYMEIIDMNRRQLISQMEKQHLMVKELPLLHHHLTTECASDGLHLGPTQKYNLFGKVIEDAISDYARAPSKQEYTGLNLSPNLREAYKLVRKLKQKSQRVMPATASDSGEHQEHRSTNLSPMTLEKVRKVRQQKRRMQRTRAAERAIYTAAKADVITSPSKSDHIADNK